jgi:hypothetical protein
MKKEVFDKMSLMLEGRIPRDQKFLVPLPPEKPREEKPAAKPKTAIEREQEQRDFSRMMFGKEAEKRYSRHVEGLPDLK